MKTQFPGPGWRQAMRMLLPLMPSLLLLLLLPSLVHAAANWTATSGPVVVSVDRASFAYSVALNGRPWLGDGEVALQCGGHRYCSECGNLTGGPVTIVNGSDRALGAFDAIERTWTAGTCTALTTSIRQYVATATIEFVSEVSAAGAKGTVTEPGATPVTASNRPVTEFPSLMLPNVLPPPPPPPPPPPFPPAPPPGPPAKVGCSDGSCEGFCSHPSVRGCGASWSGAKSLRATPTGKACGNAPQGHPCAVPADACGPGWGLCLAHSHPGLDTSSFLHQMDPATCATGAIGAFATGMSHAPIGNGCPIPANTSVDNTCKSSKGTSSYGAEPICCGDKCLPPSCTSALWPGKTTVLFGAEQAGGCADITIRPDHEPRGVLCCKLPAGSTDAPAGRTASHDVVSAAVTTPDAALDASGPGIMSWTGNSLRGMYHATPPPANLGMWSGGLDGGPIVLYSYGDASSTATAAASAGNGSSIAGGGAPTASLVIGPSNEFKVGVLSRVGKRLVAGAQGMITELPPHYSMRFALVRTQKVYLPTNMISNTHTEFYPDPPSTIRARQRMFGCAGAGRAGRWCDIGHDGLRCNAAQGARDAEYQAQPG
jgi:hypothetical protein